ncbi:alpha/beta fold hydrolase [Hyphobacterium marinum]|uniref:Alpha/beta hydrolase n=1 Tax=Hyphobacterium marinum TaxID=3116574 RepID=A0ABU7LVM3_9PROT|nr:alpha/beta hydrolase [Hyphobacterium sp. Y6023]MEE2565580.1 alpha/beta hydrolase [Hyphobacterium sp. Y6023]
MSDFPAARRIATNGIELSVHIDGPETGTPLLLVHGWPELAYSWKPVWNDLITAGYRVIAPDLRGFGASDRPEGTENYGIDALVADLTGLLDALDIKKAVFCGHDWGGIIVWHAAMLAADRVAGVIGVNTPHLPRPATPPTEAFRELGGEDHYILRFQEPGYAESRFTGREDDFFAYIFAKPPPASVLDALFPDITHIVKNFEGFEGRPERRIVVPKADRDVYAEIYKRTGFEAGLNLYRNFDANWQRMGGIDHRLAMPCLMITAECDYMLPPKLARWMPALCSDLEMHTLEGCGHWTMWERPKELAELMTAWLGTRGAP